jgi:hypothetical protein
MVDARARHAKVKDDIQRFRGYVSNRIPVVNTGSKNNSALDLPTVALERYSTSPPGLEGRGLAVFCGTCH